MDKTYYSIEYESNGYWYDTNPLRRFDTLKEALEYIKDKLELNDWDKNLTYRFIRWEGKVL